MLLLALSGCQEDEKITLVGQQLFKLDSDGHLLRIAVRRGADWQVGGDTAWCRAAKLTGTESDTLLIRVEVNLLEIPHETVWKITDGREVADIQIRQAAATGEYHYRLPVVFHILGYWDELWDEKLPDRLLYLLEKANEFYGGKNRQKIDVNLEFVPVTETPDGLTLERPGMHWQSHEKFPRLRVREFIFNEYGDVKIH